MVRCPAPRFTSRCTSPSIDVAAAVAVAVAGTVALAALLGASGCRPTPAAPDMGPVDPNPNRPVPCGRTYGSATVALTHADGTRLDCNATGDGGEITDGGTGTITESFSAILSAVSANQLGLLRCDGESCSDPEQLDVSATGLPQLPDLFIIDGSQLLIVLEVTPGPRCAMRLSVTSAATTLSLPILGVNDGILDPLPQFALGITLVPLDCWPNATPSDCDPTIIDDYALSVSTPINGDVAIVVAMGDSISSVAVTTVRFRNLRSFASGQCTGPRDFAWWLAQQQQPPPPAIDFGVSSPPSGPDLGL